MQPINPTLVDRAWREMRSYPAGRVEAEARAFSIGGCCCTRSSSPLHERVRFGPIWEYIWPSGLGPRVAEPALMVINPFPCSAPLEDVRLKEK